MRINKLQQTGYVVVLFSTLAMSACRLNTSPIPSFSNVLSPEVYCPGDQLNASYDFLREATCPAGFDCSPYFPTVQVSSDAGLFSPQMFTGYNGSFNFPSSGSSVNVLFNTASTSVLIPTERFDSGGVRIFLQRTGYHVPETQTASLFDGQQQTINHDGLCIGASPGYSAGEVWAAPRVSSRLIASNPCNTSRMPIIATVTYRDVPGVVTPLWIFRLALTSAATLPEPTCRSRRRLFVSVFDHRLLILLPVAALSTPVRLRKACPPGLILPAAY
jgi:hypothetical protein